MKSANPKPQGGKPAEPSRRNFIKGALALAAGLYAVREAAAQTVLYDEYGRPIVVGTTTTVVTAPAGQYPYAYAGGYANPVYGAAGVRGQSRRVSRRTARRTASRY
jgi:hypothetical protein